MLSDLPHSGQVNVTMLMGRHLPHVGKQMLHMDNHSICIDDKRIHDRNASRQVFWHASIHPYRMGQTYFLEIETACNPTTFPTIKRPSKDRCVIGVVELALLQGEQAQRHNAGCRGNESILFGIRLRLCRSFAIRLGQTNHQRANEADKADNG